MPTTEEIALRDPQHRDEAVMRENIADMALEEGRKQRVHDGNVERVNAGRRARSSLSSQAPAVMHA